MCYEEVLLWLTTVPVEIQAETPPEVRVGKRVEVLPDEKHNQKRQEKKVMQSY